MGRLRGLLDRLGAILGCLGGLLDRLGAILGRLGGLLDRLGAISGRLKALLGCLGPVLGASWAVLGASWAVLDASGAVLGGGRPVAPKYPGFAPPLEPLPLGLRPLRNVTRSYLALSVTWAGTETERAPQQLARDRSWHPSLLGALVLRACYVTARSWEPWCSEM
ncbi:MAG: hypothetical protein GY822_28735, partial [Deltaproteobacteria bacterium]|nr:hypothetical protein [Deltaproteobacteria bacterium]